MSEHELSEIIPEETAIKEKRVWKEVLGEDIEVPPLPPFVTPDVRKKLEDLGFELIFLPKLNIGTLADLEPKLVATFLESIHCQYPNWRSWMNWGYHNNDDLKFANLPNMQYWQMVKERRTQFPETIGTWVAVEMKENLNSALTDRRSMSCSIADKAIQQHSPSLLEAVGLPLSTTVRMPSVLEMNLLTNRTTGITGEGVLRAFEKTSTTVDGDKRILSNNVCRFRAMETSIVDSDESAGNFWFRIMIILIE